METVYLIIPVSEFSKVDFEKVLQTSSDTCLYSSDNQKMIIKWRGETPDFVNNINDKEGPFSISEVQEAMKNSRWYIPAIPKPLV